MKRLVMLAVACCLSSPIVFGGPKTTIVMGELYRNIAKMRCAEASLGKLSAFHSVLEDIRGSFSLLSSEVPDSLEMIKKGSFSNDGSDEGEFAESMLRKMLSENITRENRKGELFWLVADELDKKSQRIFIGLLDELEYRIIPDDALSIIKESNYLDGATSLLNGVVLLLRKGGDDLLIKKNGYGDYGRYSVPYLYPESNSYTKNERFSQATTKKERLRKTKDGFYDLLKNDDSISATTGLIAQNKLTAFNDRLEEIKSYFLEIPSDDLEKLKSAVSLFDHDRLADNVYKNRIVGADFERESLKAELFWLVAKGTTEKTRRNVIKLLDELEDEVIPFDAGLIIEKHSHFTRRNTLSNGVIIHFKGVSYSE